MQTRIGFAYPREVANSWPCVCVYIAINVPHYILTTHIYVYKKNRGKRKKWNYHKQHFAIRATDSRIDFAERTPALLSSRFVCESVEARLIGVAVREVSGHLLARVQAPRTSSASSRRSRYSIPWYTKSTYPIYLSVFSVCDLTNYTITKRY